MPSPTYTPLANITLGSSASSITFSSIPATFRDLVLVVAGTTTSNDAIFARFNSDATAANYPRVGMAGYGSTAASFSGTEPGVYATFFSGTQSNWLLNIMDYSATDKHKTTIHRLNYGTTEVVAVATRWTNTAAINNVRIVANSSTLAAGFTASLYGIAS